VALQSDDETGEQPGQDEGRTAHAHFENRPVTFLKKSRNRHNDESEFPTKREKRPSSVMESITIRPRPAISAMKIDNIAGG